MGVYLDQPSHYNEIIKSLEQINEVVEAHYTTGNYTVFLKVLAKDNDHLMEILSKIQKLKGDENRDFHIFGAKYFKTA
jgi:Lrp/AsnC family transcriptional regulator for asnA, asnC and gidA